MTTTLKTLIPLSLVGLLSFGSGFHGRADGASPTFNLPSHVIMSQDETHLIVLDAGNNTLRTIDLSNGHTTTLSAFNPQLNTFGLPAGGLRDGDLSRALFNNPTSAVVDSRGRIFVTDTNNNAIRLIDGETVSTYLADLNRPTGIALDENDNLFFVDTLSHRILKVDIFKNVTTVAGVPFEAGYQDGDTAQALFNYPTGITLGENGEIFIADTNNHLIRKISDGMVTTIAGTFILDETDPDDIFPMGGFGDGLGEAVFFNFPAGLVYIDGSLVVADAGNHLLRLISPQDTSGDYTTTSLRLSETNTDLHMPQSLHYHAGNDTLFVADTGNNMLRTFNFSELLAQTSESVNPDENES